MGRLDFSNPSTQHSRRLLSYCMLTPAHLLLQRCLQAAQHSRGLLSHEQARQVAINEDAQPIQYLKQGMAECAMHQLGSFLPSL